MSYYRPNAIIRKQDGTIGTTCYNYLDGIGIKYGTHHFDVNEEMPEPDEIIKEPEKDKIELIKEGSWE